jgi:flagellar basal body-associated protein FliL
MKAIGLILVGVVIGVLLVAGVMAYMVIHDKPDTNETANIDSVRDHADAVLAGKSRTDSHRGG